MQVQNTVQTYTDVARSHVDVWRTTKHFLEFRKNVDQLCRQIISTRGVLSYEGESVPNIKKTLVTHSRFLGRHWKITLEEVNE